MNLSLIRKYNVPGPRYTSYPTVPLWDSEIPSQQHWLGLVNKRFTETEKDGISLYIHLPFCESLCTYCGCNTRITKNHLVEQPYINAILKEWQIYLDTFGKKPIIRQLHLGGGTPTFFSPENLRVLINSIVETCTLPSEKEFSFEGHPNNTTREHLQSLYDLGFTRVSFGIQDLDLKVQKAINRIQPAEHVERVTKEAREIGYSSVNYDLVYGLPFQTLASVKKTIEEVIRLRPDRIAFYSYAHVPWIKPAQRSFTEDDLPKGAEKRELYETGRMMFEEAGYYEVGLDHFALPEDSLYKAAVNKNMHRNFMGYTESAGSLLIGLGVSSISDSFYGYAQNSKKLEDYYQSLKQGVLPLIKGHTLTEDDLFYREQIMNIMCKLETRWTGADEVNFEIKHALQELKEPIKDGLVEVGNRKIVVKSEGRPFIRNIAMAFDARMWKNAPETRLFSMVE